MTGAVAEQGASAATLTAAELVKFALLDEGLTISPEALAYIDHRNSGRAMTPADLPRPRESSWR